MNILNFVDSRWRDAFGGSLLHHYLPSKTWSISFFLWDTATQVIKADAVILNHLIGERNREIARRVKRNGGKVIVVPTEGRPDTGEIASWYYDIHKTDLMDLFISWDEIDLEKSISLGNPRFDIYSDQWKHLIDSRERAAVKHGLDPEKKTILFFSSYPQAKFSKKNVLFNIRDWRDLEISTKIQSRKDPLKFAQKEYRALLKFQALVSQFAEFTDYQLALKPHPMEDMGDWERFCDKHGIALITQEYVFNSLALCDVAINRVGCVTTVDAGYMGKHVIQFVDRELEEGAGKEQMKLTPHGRNFEEIMERIDYTPSSKPAPPSVANDCAKIIVDLIDTNNSQDSAGIQRLNKAWADHSASNLYPEMKIHPGKPFTQGVLYDWLWRIGHG